MVTVGIVVAILCLADGMLFVQSRIGMNDAYVGLGIVAAYTLFVLAEKNGIDPFLSIVIAGVFVLTWVVALAIWRFGKIEQKWDLGARQGAD